MYLKFSQLTPTVLFVIFNKMNPYKDKVFLQQCVEVKFAGNIIEST